MTCRRVFGAEIRIGPLGLCTREMLVWSANGILMEGCIATHCQQTRLGDKDSVADTTRAIAKLGYVFYLFV